MNQKLNRTTRTLLLIYMLLLSVATRANPIHAHESEKRLSVSIEMARTKLPLLDGVYHCLRG